MVPDECDTCFIGQKALIVIRFSIFVQTSLKSEYVRASAANQQPVDITEW